MQSTAVVASIWSIGLVLSVGAAAGARAAELPPAASPLHPNYSFARVDPGWKYEKSLIAPPGLDRARPFTEYRYRPAGSALTSKDLCFFPSGRLFEETDSSVRNGPLPLGEAHRRAFREDGTMQYYSHWKDGKCLEGFSIAADGSTERVKGGRGSLTEPSDLGLRSRRWFANGGQTIVHVHGLAGGKEQIWLNDDWGQWTRASGESLAQRKGEMGWGEQWSLSADGTVTQEFRSEPPPPGPKPAQDELRKRFLARRQEFFTHFGATVKSAGFTLEELGVAVFVAGPTTRPAGTASKPAKAN
jgi:hypothetical protein